MPTWVDEIALQKGKKYSQGDQDAVLEYIFRNIVPTHKICVEFGFNSTSLTTGTGSNCANLILTHSWKGVLFDKDNSNPGINLHKEFITPQNICEIFRKHQIPNDVDYVSIDVDSVDLWIMRALLSEFRPKVLSCEYNSHIPIDSAITMPDDLNIVWRYNAIYGASLKALYMVGEEKGYVLVHVVKSMDTFFVRKDLLPPDTHIPLETFRESSGLPLGLYVTGHVNSEHLLDYEVWRRTGDLKLAQSDAREPVYKCFIAPFETIGRLVWENLIDCPIKKIEKEGATVVQYIPYTKSLDIQSPQLLLSSHQLTYQIIKKLCESFYIVHITLLPGFKYMEQTDGILFPNSFQLTFLNRSIVKSPTPCKEQFPGLYTYPFCQSKCGVYCIAPCNNTTNIRFEFDIVTQTFTGQKICIVHMDRPVKIRIVIRVENTESGKVMIYNTTPPDTDTCSMKIDI